ncbi:hypothetical protein I4U23_013447 [Adineta vaga]|nr:hypothetical protein I4U23_013447 [Adineta vaga]
MSKIPTNRSIPTPTKPVFRERRISANSQQLNPSTNASSDNPFRLADQVTTSGKSGTVAFVGRTQFSEGEWIGIILDEVQGKNDGSYNGVRYFETDMNRGLFCRPDKVQHLPSNDVSQRISSYNPSGLSMPEYQVNKSSSNRTMNLLDASSIKNLQIGDHVVIRGTKYGILKYIGKIHINEGIWCGIKLDGPLGKHNGKIEGVRYFRCQHRFGIFAPLRHVEKIVVDSRTPRALTDRSHGSRDSYNHCRDSSPDSNLSVSSSPSSNSNHFQPRSSSHTKTSNSLKDSSTREKALSTEITNLMQKIQEKDKYIEKLQQDNQKDRFELSHTTEKMNEMEINILALQQQQDMKEKENEHLIKQQVEFNQRLEDLQFQLEEYQYPDTDQDHPVIPPDHYLLSTEKLANYEENKSKILELQAINVNLSQQNQIFQQEFKRHQELIEKEKLTDKFIEELKRQIELLKSQIADLKLKEQNTISQLATSEASYKQQIKEYQSRIDQITKESQNIRLRLSTLEEEKQTSDKRINDLLEALKHQKENIVPELEKQCQTLKAELQNRERTTDMAFSEREKYYEEQIRQYQDKINQATRETEKSYATLQYIQEENELKDRRTEALITKLKENYEQVQTELTELNNREQQVNQALNQRESFFEQQIKEYENNLNQATDQTKNIQNEFTKLEEDKASHEQKLNTIINSLKQDYENQFDLLKIELAQLQEKDRTQNIILNERIAHYEIEIKEYQIRRDQDEHVIDNLRNELIRVREEKVVQEKNFNEIIDILKYDIEKLQNELIGRLKDNEVKHQQEIQKYKTNLDHINEQVQTLRTELNNLQKEKDTNEEQLNDTIEQLKKNYETLKTDLQDRNQTQTMELNEREDQYQLQIQELQRKLTESHEEKTTIDNQLNEIINTLKQEHVIQCKELQTELDELNERERKVHKELHQREAQFDQQITEYQDKLEQARLKFEQLHTEWIKLQAEKTEFNKTINILQHDLTDAKSELENREHTQDMALNEREIHYQNQIKNYQSEKEQFLLQIQSLQSELTKLQEDKQVVEKLENELNERERKEKLTMKQHKAEYEQQIDEYQKNLELSIIQCQNVQSELANLQEEKQSNEKNLNDMMYTLKEDFEKQIELLQTQTNDLRKQHEATNNILTEKEQELHEYQMKFDQLNNQILELNQENETKQNQIQQLKTELNQNHQTNTQITNLKQQYEQTQDELFQRTEKLTAMNDKLQKEIEDLTNQNKQLSNTTVDNNTESNDKQVVIDQLTKQIDDLQQMHTDLLEKQAHTIEQYQEEKKAQEKLMKDKIGEYEMKIALAKSEFMVDMENTRLDHDQEVLRLKTQLQQALPTTKPKGKK